MIMELSATTVTTATTNNMANQQGNNFIDISPVNIAPNSTNKADARPSNGNDSPQSHMQKQQATTNTILIETSVTEPLARDNTIPKLEQTPIINNGNLINDSASVNQEKSASLYEQRTTNNSLMIKENDNLDDATKDLNTNVKQVLESLLDDIETEPFKPTIAAASQSSSLFVNDDSYGGITSIVSPIDDEDVDDDKPKDIVTLRNLELTPPPEDRTQTPEKTTNRHCKKRTHSESTDPNERPATEGRSKRQRKQTQLFQVVSTNESRKASRTSTSSIATPKSSAASSTRVSRPRQSTTKRAPSPKSPSPVIPPAHTQVSQIPPDVIFYEKNDYLAIRNEENSFYLCQLSENVRVERPAIKIRWLDTKNGGKTYFLTSHYDKVPQKSIIMPVILNKLKMEKRGEQFFSLDDQVKDSIIERLKRSLNFSSENQQ